jgi:16S rRNA (adenine1518-N6/adenine1519-N6)-dimethyltransferase
LGRRLGQHFLNRPAILDRIAAAVCGGEPPALVVEIGPGKGALTAPLLERAQKVVAIEVDPVLVYYLRQKFRDPLESGRLELIEGDVLKVPLNRWGKAIIAGNLPYYVTSPILDRVFAAGPDWTQAVFLVQAEVAARIASAPGSRDYGYLSVLAQTYAKPEILFEVPRAAFKPPPKVDSAVIRLTPLETAMPDRANFLTFASACFRQKRKTLRNNLAPRYGREKMDAVEEGRLRAEQLSVAELAALYRKLESQ